MIAKNNKNFKMKKIVTIMFLFCAVIATAQKKQFKKIAKAVDRNDIAAAMEIFNTLNENEIEADYKDEYAFYNAFTLLTNANGDVDKLLLALDQLKTAKKLGYEDEVKFLYVENEMRRSLLEEASKLTVENQEGALNIVEQLSNYFKEDQAMLFNVASLAYSTGDFNKALLAYEKLYESGYSGQQEVIKATKTSTGQQEIFKSKVLAEVAIKQGDYKDLVVEQSPSQRGAILSNLMWLYKRNDQLDKAETIFTNSFDKYPNDNSLKLNRADMLLTLGRMEEYKKAVASLADDVKDPRVFDNLGLAALNSKNYKEAIKYYQLSLKLDSENFNTLNNLAFAYVSIGNLEETTYEEQKTMYTKATKLFEKALMLQPKNEQVKQTLINLYSALKMQDKIDALQGK